MTNGKALLILALFIFTLMPGGVRSAAGVEVPPLTARVNDYAEMLSRATEQQLESVLADLEQEESTQLAVLTITSLQGESLEEVSLKMAETWGLGQKGRDNGALLLIVKNDRKLRIEVGYGLEGRLTDLVAGRIIRNVITPRFRNGDFDQGVIDGVGAMIAAVRGEFSSQGAERTDQRPVSDDFDGALVLFGFVFFLIGKILGRHRIAAAFSGSLIAPILGLLFWGLTSLVLFLIPAGLVAGLLASLIFGTPRSTGSWVARRGRGSTFGGFGGGGFGGGGFGGGGFGGGGGGFGGGGASGGW